MAIMQIMQGEHGVSEEVKLPHKKFLDQFDRLELDFELGCPGKAYLFHKIA